MTTISLNRNGHSTRIPETMDGEATALDAAPNRAQTWPETSTDAPWLRNGAGVKDDGRPHLALFCFEPPDSIIGDQVKKLAGALTQRSLAVHLFARHDFALDAETIPVIVVGESAEEDLVSQVQTFTQRACNAFLSHFAGSAAHVTLLGHEWSTFPALSILRGVKNHRALLSLHSLERQRSDLSSDVGQRIHALECAGLNEAQGLLIHGAATAETARALVPECADRIVLAEQPFPVEPFQQGLDAGTIKARYQVGPIDPTILYIGDLEEPYGPDLLMKAMPAVLKNHPQARLILVGEGSLLWPLRVYARYLNLEHAVRLAGSVVGQALNELVQAADLVAVPSRQSTPWWPIQAAWAARRPVTATHPAAPELLEHEQDSVLAYPSENSIVWGIERILFDADLRANLAQKGYEKIEKRFDWGHMAEQVEAMLQVSTNR
jgi:glycosyltransferase involved in cell wall biosynthesis